MGTDQKIAVCHIVSDDLWAGAEIAAYTMIKALKVCPDLALSAILLNDGKLASKLREMEIPVAVIDERKNNFLQIIRKAKQILGTNRIDILHSHRYKENILGGMVRKACGAKALVQTVHGAGEPFKGYKNLKINLYARMNLYFGRRYFDRIISVSDDLRSWLSAEYGSERVVTIHNAIDLANTKTSRTPGEIRNELGIDPSSPIIGAAARMAPVKGLEIFLTMARAILNKRSDVTFLLVGDGPVRSELEQQCSDLKIKNNVKFTGFRNDVIDLINCFDIMVFSSYHEGIPMALLEGMALHKPVVATAVGGITEVIENNVSGLLVKSGDEASLADSCLKILNHTQLKQKFVDAAYQRLLAEYTVEVQRQRLWDLYKALILR